MTGEVIKSFLVGLGYEVDDSSLAKFNKAISGATLKVTALFAATKAMTAGIVYGISKISEGFEQLGYEYRLIVPAINKTLLLRREMLRAYSAAGINLTKVVQQSVLLNFSLTKTKYAFEAIYKSVASRFFPLITKQSDIFRRQLYANMPKIQAALERFIKFVFKAFEAVTALGIRLWSILSRVYDFFVQLDKATDGWSTIVLGLVAAWKLLNLSFLATPLGMILTGLVAILALYDDFMTFQEGGKSLFNWGPAIPIINAIKTAASSLAKVLGSVFQAVFGIVDAFYQLFHLNFSGWADRMALVVESLKEAFSGLWEHIKNIGGVFAAIGNFISGDNMAANLASPVGATASPLGGNVQNSQTNQNVTQQTTITVQGSPDPSATGRAAAGEQTRVNADLARNLKGATR